MTRSARRSVVGALAVALALLSAGCGSPAVPESSSPTRLAATFDLQAHRGGAGLATEESLVAFGMALDLGVSTLELDVQVTKDLHVLVAHDPRVNRDNCQDTQPATAGDPLFPYAGKPFKLLTLPQVRTLDCGYQRAEAFPGQEVVRAPIAELADVFDLVADRGADDVTLNIELKTQADDLDVTLGRDVFAATVWEQVVEAGMEERVTIQSFDWASLVAVRRIAPSAALVALTTPSRLEVDREGASVWLGGLDVDDFGGDPVAAAAGLEGVVAISPRHDSPVDRGLVERAHAAGLLVIPWTVDDEEDMGRLIDVGVDGLITNYPDVLRQVMADRGLTLPAPHPAR